MGCSSPPALIQPRLRPILLAEGPTMAFAGRSAFGPFTQS